MQHNEITDLWLQPFLFFVTVRNVQRRDLEVPFFLSIPSLFLQRRVRPDPAPSLGWFVGWWGDHSALVQATPQASSNHFCAPLSDHRLALRFLPPLNPPTTTSELPETHFVAARLMLCWLISNTFTLYPLLLCPTGMVLVTSVLLLHWVMKLLTLKSAVGVHLPL